MVEWLPHEAHNLETRFESDTRHQVYNSQMLQGIDVSKWQAGVDWQKVAQAGKRFAIARSTIGRETKDEFFTTNYRRILAQGLIPGIYHVVTGDSPGPVQAANLYDSLKTAGYTKGFVVLDVERDDGATPTQVLSIVQYLCNFVRDELERTPVIYSGYFWRDNLSNHHDNFGAKLWLPYYGEDPEPWIPEAWDNWTFWQHTSTGSVPGVTGHVDLDWYDGTLSELRDLAGWEWDELATKEEIKAVVSDLLTQVVATENVHHSDVMSGIANLSANVVGNADRVVFKVDDVAESLAELSENQTNQVVSITNLVQSNQQQIISTLSVLLEQVEDDSAIAVGEEVKELVNRLHKHLCLPCTADNQ